MKKINFLLIALILFLMSCEDKTKFKTTETGIDYRFIEKTESGIKAKEGDAMKVSIKYYDDAKDSLLFDSREVPGDFRIQTIKSTYDGSIDEAFAMLEKGDSAIFKIDADNFFAKTVGVALPEFLKKGDKLRFEVRVIDIQDKAKVEEEMTKQMEELANQEITLLNDYIKENNITATPSESGLYYIQKEKGNGKKPVKGDKVSLHYTGKFLNGEVFDSSLERGQPFEFLLGEGQVIAGWDEGVALMSVGEKATFVIPSKIGYGPNGIQGAIPAYSTLIFEVVLLEILPK